MRGILRRTFAVPGTDLPSAPACVQPVLERLRADSMLHFGVPDARLQPVDYRERPFSHVLRVAVFTDDPDRPATHLFVKVFKARAADVQRISARVAQDFETTSRVRAALSRWNDLGVVRGVACYPDHLASVTEETAGTTLSEYLHGGAMWLSAHGRLIDATATMERVGRWVRAFQTIAPSQGCLTLDRLRSYVDLRLARLVELPAAGFDATDRRRVLAHIDRLWRDVDPVDLEEVPIHADLAPGNIIVTPGRITVLDFAMSSAGSRLHDLSRLFLQVELMTLKPQFRPPVLRQLNASMLRGFDPELDASRPMFRLLSMQHRVNHLATLSSAKESFPTSAYNWHVRRNHRAWIADELRRSERGE
jgi:hypothetical protein